MNKDIASHKIYVALFKGYSNDYPSQLNLLHFVPTGRCKVDKRVAMFKHNIIHVYWKSIYSRNSHISHRKWSLLSDFLIELKKYPANM